MCLDVRSESDNVSSEAKSHEFQGRGRARERGCAGRLLEVNGRKHVQCHIGRPTPYVHTKIQHEQASSSIISIEHMNTCLKTLIVWYLTLSVFEYMSGVAPCRASSHVSQLKLVRTRNEA
jgi:hypothetical protein